MMGFNHSNRFGLEKFFYEGVVFFPAPRSIMVIISSAAMQVNASQEVPKIFQQISLVRDPEIFLARGMADVVPIEDRTSRKFVQDDFKLLQVGKFQNVVPVFHSQENPPPLP